ncbi:HAD family hydrolase [Bifidobacterium simiarum]|uniref:Beta-phosphoglucomutase n=1 Tax=Bifidobacterium simiarum TaxID=2045441 RepID=A0A2M9HHC3_9BIFI|nr:HAD family phosphatase [Bifidobacterium simiarum]MBT1165294.1 HAD family phosphatase [Bifidobacterium simiarum]PJM76181.1 beta-phosphoglucomutase [Bifidobacterium simiarum]
MSNAGRAAIFDLDGTLLDSMRVWTDVDNEFLRRRGLDVPSDYAESIAHLSFDECARYTVERFGLPDSPEDLMDEWNRMAFDAYATTVPLKPHAGEYLRYLKATGAKLAVATSLPPNFREPVLRRLGVFDLFDVLCSVDDVGHVSKDKPDVYLRAASRIGVDPTDCTVFEDILVGIRAVKSVGMTAWAMYDASSRGQWPLICEIADGTMHDFVEAPRTL